MQYQLAAACMTWELAESGKHFITTIINGSDLVPTFSTASIDNLRSEVWYLISLLNECPFILLRLSNLSELFSIWGVPKQVNSFYPNNSSLI